MFCLLLSLGTFCCGVLYLRLQYEVPIGWLQVFLGTLCLILVFVWQRTVRREKNAGVQQESPREADL